MARQTATLVEYLMLQDLTRPELDALIRAVRYEDAEEAAIDRMAEAGESVIDRDNLTLKMSEAEAQAQREARRARSRRRIAAASFSRSRRLLMLLASM